MGWLKGLGIALVSSCAVYAATVNNPIMYVDSPDPSIVRVDDAYYMSKFWLGGKLNGHF